MSFLIYPTPKLMPIQGLTGFGGGATGLQYAGGVDVDYVIDTIEKVGLDLQKDKDFKSKINGNIEVFGLDKFDDSAIIIKGRIPTIHKQQWIIRREFNRRIKLAFDKNGIEIPFPQRTIS